MLSLDNVFDYDELRTWIGRIEAEVSDGRSAGSAAAHPDLQGLVGYDEFAHRVVKLRPLRMRSTSKRIGSVWSPRRMK